MARFVGFDEVKSKGNGGGGSGGRSSFLKLQAGNKYRVRLVSKPVQFYQHWEPVICRSPREGDPLMAMGYEPKERYSIWVINRDTNEFQVMDFPVTLAKAFKDWQEAFPGEAVGGKNGCDWQIKVEIPPGGTKRQTKYSAMALDRTPFTPEEVEYIKSNDLAQKLLELRKDHTPEEIRAMLNEKGADAPSQPQGAQSPRISPPSAAPTVAPSDSIPQDLNF